MILFCLISAVPEFILQKYNHAYIDGNRPEARRRRIKMSKEKFEHEEELDCEVTVFEGAHTTCEKIEDESSKERTAEKKNSSKAKKRGGL